MFSNATHVWHIVENEFIEVLKAECATSIVRRTVLYRGDDTETPQYGARIPYYNINEFLQRVENGDIF